MYTSYYQLRERPFNIVPNPAYLFPSSKHHLAQLYLEYGLKSGNGFILLTGDVGTGKTTLIRQLMRQIGEDMEVAVIFNTNVSHQELLKLILQELEIETGDEGKAGLLNRLNDYLIERFAENRKVLLIIDEAQNLSSEALEEVRMLSNLQSDTSTLLQIMLVGQPELRRKLARPEMSQLVQRIGVRFHLGPLSRAETGEYIAHRLEKAGSKHPDLFTSDAVDLIFQHAGGVPRSINLLCDAALVYGFADEAETITAEIVEQVIEDRQEELGQDSFQGVTNVPAKEGTTTAATQILDRLGSLESRLEKLAAQVSWQERELSESLEQSRAQLILKLEQQAEQERRRGDGYLKRLGLYREEIKRLRSELDSCAEETPGEAQDQPGSEQPPARKGGLFGLGRKK